MTRFSRTFNVQATIQASAILINIF